MNGRLRRRAWVFTFVLIGTKPATSSALASRTGGAGSERRPRSRRVATCRHNSVMITAIPLSLRARTLYANGYSVRQVSAMTGISANNLRRGFCSQHYPIQIPSWKVPSVVAWGMLRLRIITFWLLKISRLGWRTINAQLAAPRCKLDEISVSSLDWTSRDGHDWYGEIASDAKTPLELLMEKEENQGWEN